ncbi:hypothetical protein KVT40_002354 [Elsinoe batatas]|uniref:Zn(2)-C6 fungal-type domain-containing protein n=1 Tax=Elsinoe batatas TaxID=2601811 RepID=A0A8K0PFW3_9PEZI|nr:hypothetical protein KVT40_002354 [Elsinoe batatas]
MWLLQPLGADSSKWLRQALPSGKWLTKPLARESPTQSVCKGKVQFRLLGAHKRQRCREACCACQRKKHKCDQIKGQSPGCKACGRARVDCHLRRKSNGGNCVYCLLEAKS